MTKVQELAAFIEQASFERLSEQACYQLQIRILDSLGCAIGALEADPAMLIRNYVEEFGGSKHCTLIGGGTTSPDRAAFYNGALIRYLDYNDSYLAEGETCHPSDNLGAVLAAAEYAGCRGAELITSLAIAYQVQCRLSDVAPVRAKGFDHTSQGAFAAAAGVSKALRLNVDRIANALAISGTAFHSLRVTRTGRLSQWKGLAYANTGFGAIHAAFLARQGITGPLEVFEGNKGFMETISGCFEIDWQREDLDRVLKTIVKRYNAEIHSQSVLEDILALPRDGAYEPSQIEQIEIEIFEVAFQIIGGGEEGDKRQVGTKEEADHSLPYLVAVALLDGQVEPEQFEAERIRRKDVQRLLRKVQVRPSLDLSARFPDEMPCRIRIQYKNGQSVRTDKNDYEGFHSRPASWETVTAKFNRLAAACDPRWRGQVVRTVRELPKRSVVELTDLLGRIDYGGDPVANRQA